MVLLRLPHFCKKCDNRCWHVSNLPLQSSRKLLILWYDMICYVIYFWPQVITALGLRKFVNLPPQIELCDSDGSMAQRLGHIRHSFADRVNGLIYGETLRNHTVWSAQYGVSATKITRKPKSKTDSRTWDKKDQRNRTMQQLDPIDESLTVPARTILDLCGFTLYI